jgi:hypothetical protein
MKSVKDQVTEQVQIQIRRQVWDQAAWFPSVDFSQVWVQVYEQVKVQVRNQVWNQIGRKVLDKAREES